MRCRKAQEWISLWMDKRLNAHQEQELLEHIQHCEDCGRIASQWERLQAMLKAYPQITPSTGLDARVWQAIREQWKPSAW
ncbi:MAG: anti-sigma factor family protein [Armatimonadota bacterium]